jgi:hypothetical protein
MRSAARSFRLLENDGPSNPASTFTEEQLIYLLGYAPEQIGCHTKFTQPLKNLPHSDRRRIWSKSRRTMPTPTREGGMHGHQEGVGARSQQERQERR